MNTPFNPYAFPSHGSMGEVVQEGMSLRDYFAANAMQALMRPEYYEVDTVQGIEAIAANAYDLADAMLRARGES